MTAAFSRSSYHRHIDTLAGKDRRLQQIIDQFGYPPFWSRPPGFPGLARIILEQQVSLASALSTWNRLENRLGLIRAQTILTLPEQELADLGITRQKRGYIRGLAAAVVAPGRGVEQKLGQPLAQPLDLQALGTLSDDQVRAALTAVKGIGPWTADIYLIMGLHRMDVFPARDLALNKALDSLGILPMTTPPQKVYRNLSAFSPYRSLLACLLWHWYIQTQTRTRA